MTQDIRILAPTCNYSCIFCHNEGLARSSGAPMTCEELRSLIEEATKAGYGRTVYLSGGEPLLFESARRFLRELPLLSSRCIVVSNGSLLWQLEVELLFGFEVHLDVPSFDRSLYAIMTGQKTCSLEDVLDRARNLVAHGIPVDVNYVLCRGLNTSVAALKKAVQECRRLGFRSIRLIELLPIRHRDILELFLPLDSVQGMGFLAEFSEVTSASIRTKRFIAHSDGFEVDLVRCSCALPCASCGQDRDLYCTVDGRLIPCMLSAESFSIRELGASVCVGEYINYYARNLARIAELRMKHVGF